MNVDEQKSYYIRSLNQLITISSILAGFTFSGLISLPGIEKGMFNKIVHYFQGNLDLSFYMTFYSLFFATICFLSSIMIVLVYKVNNFTIPFLKLKRVYLITNISFSLAISALMMAVISFGIPNKMGIFFAGFFGIVVGGSFIWENMLPQQIEKRKRQVEKENIVEEASSTKKNDDVENKISIKENVIKNNVKNNSSKNESGS